MGQRLASIPFEELVPCLQGLHWHKVKAQRLVAACKMIVNRFDGRVPVDEALLRTLPGIGPKLAHVLGFVFAGETMWWQHGRSSFDDIAAHEELVCGTDC